MHDWRSLPEAAAILAAIVADPPPTREHRYRFGDRVSRYTGDRVRRLRQLRRAAEPPLDTPAWRDWVRLGEQQAIALALRDTDRTRTACYSTEIPPATAARNEKGKVMSEPELLRKLDEAGEALAGLGERIVFGYFPGAGLLGRAGFSCRLELEGTTGIHASADTLFAAYSEARAARAAKAAELDEEAEIRAQLLERKGRRAA